MTLPGMSRYRGVYVYALSVQFFSRTGQFMKLQGQYLSDDRAYNYFYGVQTVVF